MRLLTNTHKYAFLVHYTCLTFHLDLNSESEDLSGGNNITVAQQRLFFPRTLNKANLPQKLMLNVYNCAIHSVLT